MPDEKRTAPEGEFGGPNARWLAAPPSVGEGSDDLEHFTKRVILDALNEASRQWWLQRAEVFERARPMPGEFHGNRTPEQLRAQWHELSAIAQACRARAGVCEPEDGSADFDNVWSEMAA